MTTNELPAAYAELNSWIRSRNRFLVITHLRPDGDAIGSAQGMAAALRALGKHSACYFLNEVPPPFQPFIDQELTLYGDIDLSPFDTIVTVDCAAADRLAVPNELDLDELNIPCANIDHHISNDGFGDCDLVDPSTAATSEALSLLFEAFNYPMTPEIATALLVGVITDCGGFRFNNTSSQTLRTTAWLVENGGDYHQVMDKMYFNEPASRMRLQGKVLEDLTLSINDRVATFFVTDELLDSCHATQEDAENLVDIVRCIQGVEIVCRMQQMGDNVRFSLRSTNPARPIIGIAKEIGGGGHALAAGATMEKATLKQAEARFLELAKGLFND